MSAGRQAAGLTCIVAFILPLIAVGCSGTSRLSHGGWTFDESSGALLYGASTVPEALARRRVTLVTPLGTFVHIRDRGWARRSFMIPLPDPHTTCVEAHACSAMPPQAH